jgi:hypothetical protein
MSWKTFSDNALASLFSTEQKYPRDPKFVGFPTRGCASSLLCLLLWHHSKQGGIHLVCLQNFQTIYHPPLPLYAIVWCVRMCKRIFYKRPPPHYTGTYIMLNIFNLNFSKCWSSMNICSLIIIYNAFLKTIKPWSVHCTLLHFKLGAHAFKV